MPLTTYLQRCNATTISMGLIAGMFSIPFINPYHHVPDPTFYHEWLAALLGTLALLPLLTPSFWQAPALPRVSLLWLGLLLFSYVQALFMTPSAPQLALIQSYFLWAFLITLLGDRLRRQLGMEAVVRCLAWALLVANGINAWFVVLQMSQKLGVTLPIAHYRHYGLLAQSNHFANFVGLGLVSLLYLHSKQRVSLRWTIVGLATALTLLTFSGSRSAVLYLLLIATWSGWFWLRSRHLPHQRQTNLRLWGFSLCVIPCFLLLQLVCHTWLPETLIQTPLSRAMAAINDPAQSARWQFWQTSWYLFTQSPLFGHGLGLMRWQTFLLVDQPALNPAHRIFEHAHNLFLNVMAEMGLVGLAIVLVPLGLWTITFFRRQSASFETWWILGCLSILGMHSQLEYPLWYSHFLGVFALLIGIGDTTSVSLVQFSNNAKRLLRATLIGLVMYAAWQLMVMQQANRMLEERIQIKHLGNMSPPEKQEFVEDMLWIDQHTLLAPYGQLLLTIYFTSNPAQTQLQRAIAERAIHFMPLRRACLNLVLILAEQQQNALALAYLSRLLVVANGNLAPDIQQLPVDQADTVRRLLLQLQSQHSAAPAHISPTNPATSDNTQ